MDNDRETGVGEGVREGEGGEGGNLENVHMHVHSPKRARPRTPVNTYAHGQIEGIHVFHDLQNSIVDSSHSVGRLCVARQ